MGSLDFGDIEEGQRTAVGGADLDGDGVIDFAVGNLRGGVAFYKGDFVLDKPEPPMAIAQFGLAPNPSTGVLQVHVQTPAAARVHVRVYDLHGRTRTQADGHSNGQPIDVPTLDLPAGVYAVALDVNGKPAGVKRWVLMR